MTNETALEDRERQIVSTIFLWGVSLSALAMVGGFLLDISTGDHSVGAIDLSHLGDMTLAGALMAIGIGILAATPVANVVALLFIWARHRRYTLVATASTVLLTLTVALILGRG